MSYKREKIFNNTGKSYTLLGEKYIVSISTALL